MRNVLSAIAMVAVLASCGGGGGGTPGGPAAPPKPVPVVTGSAFDTFASFETAFDAFEAEKTAQFHTAYTGGVSFPTSGTASFSGMYRSVLDGAGTPTVLIGLADVTADFEAGTIAGGADSFVGQIGGGATGFYAGSVTFTDGKIGKDAGLLPEPRQNDFGFDYAGTLTGNGQVIELSGSNQMGKFLQTPITGIEATGTSTATINGLPVTDEMSLYADRD